MPVNQKREPPIMVGYYPPTPNNGSATVSLDAAATWLALSFAPDATKTLSKVRVLVGGVVGTLAAANLTCQIYSDSGGVPNASLATATTLGAAPTGAGFLEFTGFSLSVSAGSQYWIVLKNTNGTPASNYAYYRFGSYSTANQVVNGYQSTWGWTKAHTTNSGGAWGTQVNTDQGWRLEYSDGSFDGTPVDTFNTTEAAVVATTTEVGVVLVTPAGARWNVRGVSMFVNKLGTPAGSLRYRLYNNTTLIATTTPVPVGNVPTGMGWLASYFTADQVIEPGTVLRVALGTTTGGDASNCYRTCSVGYENNADSKALMPFAQGDSATNAAKKSVLSGGSWTDTDTVLIPFALLLNSDSEFSVSGRGGAAIQQVSGQNMPVY